MIEFDFDDSVTRGLERYVRLVRLALGLSGECSYVHVDDSASAYIALEGRLRRHPDRDVALLWDEQQGWAAAIETHSGEDLLVVARLDGDVLPPPRTVATWTGQLFRTDEPVHPIGHRRQPATAEDVRSRLVNYATSAFTPPPAVSHAG